ncbi:MAG: hypothetical protein ABW085_16815 [Sedimenticola sp.]
MTDSKITLPVTPEERLWQLHDSLINRLMKEIENRPRGELKASLIAVARAFLLDNGITTKNLPVGLRQAQNLRKNMKLPFDGGTH